MKKLLSLALVLCLLALCGAALAEGDLLSEIRERGTLVIATEGNWSPWTYHDESDTLVGLDVEIGTLIAEGLGVTPEFQETPATAWATPRPARKSTLSPPPTSTPTRCWP